MGELRSEIPSLRLIEAEVDLLYQLPFHRSRRNPRYPLPEASTLTQLID